MRHFRLLRYFSYLFVNEVARAQKKEYLYFLENVSDFEWKIAGFVCYFLLLT